jgi:hypothetical protein
VLLDLTAKLGAVSTVGLNQSQHNVANALSTYFNSGAALPSNFASVFGLTNGPLANALTEFDGEAATEAERTVFPAHERVLTLMLDSFVNGSPKQRLATRRAEARLNRK